MPEHTVLDEREKARLTWWENRYVSELGQVLICAAVGFFVVGIIVILDGHNPFHVLTVAFRGAVLNWIGIVQSLAVMSSLLLAALAFAISMRCGLFNIGGEGTLIIGAATAVAAGGLISAPPMIHHMIVIVAAMAGGILWSIPVALLKVSRNVHEVVSTIMANFVALYFVQYLVVGPLRDTQAGSLHIAVKVAETARFSVISISLTSVIYVAVLTAVLVYFILWHTKQGMHMRATGFETVAARYSGVSVSRMMVYSFALSGAVAALAGMALTAGLPPQWTIGERLAELRGIGFLGIAVAMLGRNHPIACIAAAFFIATIKSSKVSLQMIGVSPEITNLLIGIIVIAFAVPEIFQFTMRKLDNFRRTRA